MPCLTCVWLALRCDGRKTRVFLTLLGLVGLLPCASFAAGPPSEPAAPVRLRVVGGLGALPQYLQWEQPFWSRELQRLSGGRYSAEILPYDQAGLPEVEMLRLLQLGVLSFATVSLDAMGMHYPQYSAVDLAGLNTDMASLRTSLAAFRPYLELSLREQQGVELLAVYTYPAQVLFCKQPLRSLEGLAGRAVRVASSAQADFVRVFGALPERTRFGQMMDAIERGGVECAITGTSSARAIGLQQQAPYMYAMPLGWGLTVFAANRAAWDHLPPELQQLLRRELAQLEARIWRAAEQETAQALQCAPGKPPCETSARAAPVLQPQSSADAQRCRKAFLGSVLPRWLLRCSVDCASIWRKTLGKVPTMALPALP